MSRITVSIGSKDFDITVDEDFARFFERDFAQAVGSKKNIEIKDLLWAYVQKSYDQYQNEQQIATILKKIEQI